MVAEEAVQALSSLLDGSLASSATDTRNQANSTTQSLTVNPEGSTTMSLSDHVNRLELSDLNKAGYALLPISLTFIVVNALLLALVGKRWNHIRDSRYFNSCLFCLFLTCSDLALSLLLGLPIGIRFSFERQLRRNEYLKFYTQSIGFVIYEYLYILRVIIIAVISTDRFLHVFWPFKYMALESKGWIVRVTSGIIFVAPFLRLAPVLILFAKGDANIRCDYYKDEETHLIPLTCVVDKLSITLPGFNVADMVIMTAINGVSWVILLASNVFILALLFRRASTGYFTSERRNATNIGIVKSSITVLIIAISFAITNFPSTYVWALRIFYGSEKDHKLYLFLTLLIFLSLFFNPWLYTLRMKNVRDEVICEYKRTLLNLNPPSTSTQRVEVGTASPMNRSPKPRRNTEGDFISKNTRPTRKVKSSPTLSKLSKLRKAPAPSPTPAFARVLQQLNEW